MLKQGQIVALDQTSALLSRATASVLRFKTDQALPAAVQAAARVTGRVVQLPAPDAVAVERWLAQVREAGVVVSDIEVRKADLEDVFLDIMGAQP
jgi:ABC-2 type transport system ATP-binding protein